jgi:hypothetical protein
MGKRTEQVKPKLNCMVYRKGELIRTEVVTGRVAWALLSLIKAGSTGCTPINRPAPRWSDYVFRLRGQGINVETKTEDHGGAYAGTHAVYILHDDIRIVGGNLAEYLRSSDGVREFGGVSFAIGAPA